MLEALAAVPGRALRRRPVRPARTPGPGAPRGSPARSARPFHNVRGPAAILAAFVEHVGQVDVAHGIAGMARRGFGVRGSRGGSIARVACSSVPRLFKRQAVRGRARQHIQIGVAGFQRAAEFGQQAGALQPRRHGFGIARPRALRPGARRLREPRAAANRRQPPFADAALRAARSRRARPNATVRSTSRSRSAACGAVIHDGGANRQAFRR